MAFLDKSGLQRLWTHILNKLSGKVDKIDGMGLSSNDFTAEEKERLSNAVLHTEIEDLYKTLSSNTVLGFYCKM